MKVPFLDLQAQLQEINKDFDRALGRLLKRGDFILGEDVAAFEGAFGRYLGVKHALGVNSGTDALFLGLLSLGIGTGDEVIVPAYTYIASAFAVSYTGAKPVFVDIDEATFNIDPGLIERSLTSKTKAIMPVHLYGQSCDMDPLLAVARKHGLRIIEDAAQAHGTEYRGRKAGSIGDVGCFSFYPTKNLGGFGDGGLIATNDGDLFARLKRLRDYGRKSRYEHVSMGYNSRLDSVQAALLFQKLKKLDRWNAKRTAAARRYRERLTGAAGVMLPFEADYGKHVYHIFAVRMRNRDEVMRRLQEKGVQTMVHYPVPLHLQEVYSGLGYRKGDFPIAEKVCAEVLCLPIFPHIKKGQIDHVADALKKAGGVR